MKMAIIDNGIEIHAGVHLDFGEVASRAHTMIEIICSLWSELFFLNASYVFGNNIEAKLP